MLSPSDLPYSGSYADTQALRDATCISSISTTSHESVPHVCLYYAPVDSARNSKEYKAVGLQSQKRSAPRVNSNAANVLAAAGMLVKL
jgi:hypothetical protein